MSNEKSAHARHRFEPHPVLGAAVLVLGLLLSLLLAGCTAAGSAETNPPAATGSADINNTSRAIDDAQIVALTYPYTRDQMLEILASTYPDVPEAEREAWLELDTTETREYDGELHYFGDLPANLGFRDVELFRTNPQMAAKYRKLYDMMLPYIEAAASADPLQPYAEPVPYTFTQSLTISRNRLPATGNFELWFPLPIEGGPQTDVVVTDTAPREYLSLPPSTSDGIGLLYMNVPLDTLTTDLDASITFSFAHAPQYFKIEPTLVGQYDPESALYRTYTASRANTAITPEIRAKADEVVNGETNPYLAAKRLYDYVVGDIEYSLMPHLCLYPRGEAESVYVHEHGCGDCGAQSMYFSALCRSVGIPARTTGGFQIFFGKPGGHFWAEIYLPNYGWIPVDTSVAQTSKYVPGLSEAEHRAYRDFFFGNQDPFRLVVQHDTDLELIPKADGLVLLPLAIQTPAALCEGMQDIPGLVAAETYTIE